MSDGKKLGELLIELEVVTPEQLELALAEQSRTKGKLGRILTKLGLTTEEAIAQALARQSGVEHFDVSAVNPPASVLARISKQLARSAEVFPVDVADGALVLAMANPTDIVAIDRAQQESGLFVRVVSSPRSAVVRAIARCYAEGEDEEIERAIQDAVRSVESGDPRDAGVVTLVERLVEMAVAKEATDLHLEPDEQVLRVRVRVDGRLQPGPTLPTALAPAIVARIKILAVLDISETRAAQDGKFSHSIKSRKIELRVSTFPSVSGESVVLRILDPSRAQISLDAIGLDERQRAILLRAARRPNGLILVTGPTGSGKTTTLYALLRAINAPDLKIITLEDPVEYQLPLLTQCQINEKAGIDFSSGLRSILRHDPDVILVGEMRDAETAQISMRAALTGHLVLSTLHTNDASSCVVRLQDMGIPPYLTGSCLAVVIAQRLVRRLCSRCREAYPASPEELRALGLEEGAKLWSAAGCASCHETGSEGRSALFEVLEVTPAVARAIVAGASLVEVEREALESGFAPFRAAAVERASIGEISFEELARVVGGED